MLFSMRLCVCVIFFMAIAVVLSADTIPGGDVSGTWYQANSPYYITGNITIPSSDTLVIEPGVEIYFMGWQYITINGILEAMGTESDSIFFAPDTSTPYYAGLHFDNAQDTSHLQYCSISGVFGIHLYAHIHCTNSSDPVISHCRITGDSGWVDEGNIWVESSSNPSISDCVITGGNTAIQWSSTASNAIISGCTISNCIASGVLKYMGNLTMIDCSVIQNHSDDYHGAGIRSIGGNLTLINCTIADNFAHGSGGGIYCKNATHTLMNCTINDNNSDCGISPVIGGGGVCFDDANASLSYCTFHDNRGHLGGGAITINGTGSLTIDHCTIDDNEAWDNSSHGIWLRGNPTTDITNTILTNNYGYTDGCIYNQGTLTVEYSDFHNNEGSAIVGNVPAGFGVLDRVNYNSDSCDCYYNIFMDPMYVDTAIHDYHLTENSPCIDAGDPAFAYDPDSTITDIGRYYYPQTGIAGDYPQNASPVKLTCLPNPFATTTTIRLSGIAQRAERLEIKIYDISGRLVKSVKLATSTYQLGADLKAGVYFVKVDGSLQQKVVKLH